MKYKSILVVTYGRSGSTLLQGLLNSIDNVVVRGENHDFCWGLYSSWKSLVLSKQQHGGESSTTDAWFGAGLLNADLFLQHASEIIKEQLQLPDESLCYGFKEIRYIKHLHELPAYLNFLQKAFPSPAIIFNTRSHQSVIESGWWKTKDRQEVESLLKFADKQFFDYADQHENTFIMRYENIIRGAVGVTPLFDFLETECDESTLEKVLSTPHGYEQRQATIKTMLDAEQKRTSKTNADTTSWSIPPGIHKDISSSLTKFSNGIVVVAVMKDEILRLPWFLNYYRRLGCAGFLIIDDGSTDGTIDFLLSQDDVMLFHSGSESYADSKSGTDWFNALVRRYARNKWVLCVDTDELLCWPFYKRQGLSGLVKKAERLGLKRVFTPMIDAYSDKAVSEMGKYEPGSPFGDACPWIDPVDTMTAAWSNDGRLLLRGGPRKRFHQDSSMSPPLLTKQSLYFVEEDGAYLLNSHFDSHLTPSPLVAPLLHYKFLPDFSDRVEKAIREGEHWNDAAEYKNYRKQSLWDKNLKIKSSVRVNSGLDLAGHIKAIQRIIIQGLARSSATKIQ